VTDILRDVSTPPPSKVHTKKERREYALALWTAHRELVAEHHTNSCNCTACEMGFALFTDRPLDH